MRAGDLDRLEAAVATLRERVVPQPRPLLAIGRIVGPSDDPLPAIRTSQHALFEAKLGSILEAPGRSPDPA